MAHKGIISIPSELITEILYRLPSKSVGRFRSVSKEWLSPLSSPEFIKTHQNTLNRNYLFFRLSSSNEINFIPFHYHAEANKEEEEESVPTKFQLQFHNNKRIHGSCNGLVLLSAFRLCSGHETLIISNPTTREFVELPDCDFKIEGHRFVYFIMRDLGYDSVTDDYKVVTINRFQNPTDDDLIMCVHVYSLRRNTWTRVIDFPDKYHWPRIRSKALVNGSFHWVAYNVPDQTKVIVAFNLADENFSEVPSPTLSNGNDLDIFYKTCRVVVVDEKLAIFLLYEGEVWLMNEYGVKGSWTKIKLYGLEQIHMFDIRFVFYGNGKLVLVCDNEMLLFDIEDGRLSKRIDTSGYRYPRADTHFSCVCVESLVSPIFNRVN
ncbi:F-box/kelch-repeat protein At3g06240-like [Rutidosis leptorrhynchoides]|uniref:F-box/kelch-repeat protein At3g06240-like n=1 Tax=Rutidosis leptorrhynchoides TaxID=125765 RepID=UPI003A9A41E7